jgi:dehydrogenase/reductase SDR family protein 12
MTEEPPRLADLLDRALDWTVLPGYSKIGYSLREHLVPRGPLDLSGKTAIVTGATSGIGEATSAGLARQGALVHLVVRDLEKGEAARSRIARAAGVEEGALTLHRCDLSSLASVRAFTGAFLEGDRRLDVLVNNAGVMPPEREYTEEGFELTFATNVLGPFLLTAELVPALGRGTAARVINVSSGGMYTAKLDLDDPQLEKADFSGNRFYAHTKRAEVVLGDEWARLLAPQVAVFSMHPGWVATPGLAASLPGFDKVMKPLLRDAEGGADTIVWLAGSPALVGQTGGFWHDRRRRSEHRLRNWPGREPSGAIPDRLVLDRGVGARPRFASARREFPLEGRGDRCPRGSPVRGRGGSARCRRCGGTRRAGRRCPPLP